MLSSNSSSCNPFPENDLTSKSDPNFLFTFPASPNLQYDDVLYFLDTFYHTTTTTSSAAAWNDTTTPVAAVAENRNPIAATAAVKKDRHSKINTARGPRDRRMRLSLDIARKFFDLQDLLGYDKASRTVDWLLRSSRNAIRELQRATSCTSEECSSTTALATAVVEEEGCCSKVGNGRSKRGRGVVQPKRASVGRESRKKARDRARERTSQKRRLMRENGGVFGECRHFPAAAEELSSDEARANEEGVFFFDFNHHNENNSAAFLHQDEQIAEFQFNGKPWEAYNSFSLS